MAKLHIPVKFEGSVTVEVPERLSPKDGKLLATKLVLARILATTDNPDAPEEQACEDYAEKCSVQASFDVDDDWDACVIHGVSGKWETTNG